MSIAIEVTRSMNGAEVKYVTTAANQEEAHQLASFLTMGPSIGGSAQNAAPAALNPLAETKPAKKEPEAKKPAPASASDTTPKSSPAPSEQPPADAKAYSYDDVKALIVKLASPTGGIADGRAKAVALLGRFGMKVLPKDAGADTLAQMGALAEQTIAGEIDPRDAVEA